MNAFENPLSRAIFTGFIGSGVVALLSIFIF